VVDFVRTWSGKTRLPVEQFLAWLELAAGKYYDWRQRYGKVNQHNGWVPREFWLHDWEKQKILDFQVLHPLVGYRRLTYMMMDADVVAVSPTSVWRALHQAGRLERWPKPQPSKKGTGFEQPTAVHQHWHSDITHINIHGTFYFLCAALDGASRFILAWDIRESATEADVEIVLQKAREKFPGARPRIITDNGPPYVAKDFKEFIRISGMTHVRTSPYYPQSNGKFERWNKSLKSECIRPGVPLSLDDARRLIEQYVQTYNEERLHSALGYVTPRAALEGQSEQIHAERDRKLEQARLQREQQLRTPSPGRTTSIALSTEAAA